MNPIYIKYTSAALTLAKRNRVVLSYRRGEFSRLFKDNRRQIDEAIREGGVEVVFNSNVTRFEPGHATLEVDRGGSSEERTVNMQHGFVLIGAELPVRFLKSLGIRLENEWTGSLVRSVVLTAATLFGLGWLGTGWGGAAPFGLELGSSMRRE